MISNITSGEWIASPEEGTTEWRVDAGTWGIAICADFPGDGEVEANARLIAAAPDLLEALIFFLDGLRTYAPEHMHGLQKDRYIRKASSAIAKATGGQQ